MVILTEGKALINVSKGKITRKMPVFYNPSMKLNRDISVLLLKSAKNSKMKIADALAASGIRSIRFALELNKSKIKSVYVNDASKTAAANIKKNLKLNRLKSKIFVTNEDANLFLLKNRPFDYIDIDPFGTPTGFLDASVKSLSRNAILGITATDTAALSGTSPKACARKYWAKPLKNYMMHELGLRILIRRAQLAAASNEKALIPIYSYSLLHYMKVFFRCTKKISDVDKIIKQHQFVSYCKSCLQLELATSKCSKCKSKTEIAGPLWTGQLFDSSIANAIDKNNNDSSNDKLLKIISEEARIPTLGYYDTHAFCKKLKLNVPPLETIIESLRKHNFNASRTHLSVSGIRTNAPLALFKRILVNSRRTQRNYPSKHR